jgi:ABC-type protease/lipase transport system fused ATPase/permease subunit
MTLLKQNRNSRFSSQAAWNEDGPSKQAVRSACQDCAVICIAHRLQTIMDYDQLAVLDKGNWTALVFEQWLLD